MSDPMHENTRSLPEAGKALYGNKPFGTDQAAAREIAARAATLRSTVVR